MCQKPNMHDNLLNLAMLERAEQTKACVVDGHLRANLRAWRSLSSSHYILNVISARKATRYVNVYIVIQCANLLIP